MVFPSVKIQWMSDDKGYGLVATQDIPKGTITFAQDGLDIVIACDDLPFIDPKLFEYVEKYSYEDFEGNRIISWDLGKYMNHDDNANTLSTGYGFEIAVRDIEQGEEVTDDYRIFSTHHNTFSWTKKSSGQSSKVVPFPQTLLGFWDTQVFSTLQELSSVDQPLLEFIDDNTINSLKQLKTNPKLYRSVEEAFPLRLKRQLGGILADSRTR